MTKKKAIKPSKLVTNFEALITELFGSKAEFVNVHHHHGYYFISFTHKAVDYAFRFKEDGSEAVERAITAIVKKRWP